MLKETNDCVELVIPTTNSVKTSPKSYKSWSHVQYWLTYDSPSPTSPLRIKSL